jgi:Skp family chaperone for outer membrane proteins
MFRKATAISEVLEKLSRGFEQYVDILSYMRGEYFNILERLSSGDVYHLERAIDRAESDRELRALQDQFLDMYSEYMKTNKAELKEQLRELAKKIQRIDESFRFTMDQI